MPASRALLGFASLVLIGASCLFILFLLIGGAVDSSPFGKFYFLQADTAGIAGASDTSRWTLWNTCGVRDGNNDCGAVHPAYPLNPPANFPGPDDNIPKGFLGTSQYYYMTRFMFAFILIGGFFAVVALFLGLLALCSRFGSYLNSALVSVALFFQAIAASLMTAAYVKGRDQFQGEGRSASLGKYNFGWMWGSVGALFLAMIFFCAGGAVGGSKSSSGGSGKRRGFGGGFGGGFAGKFGRKKSTRRDRGSFIDRSSFEKSDRPLPLTNGA